MENLINDNAAEIIPFKNHKQKFIIVRQELMKNRYVEVWDRVIYSAKKWEDLDHEKARMAMQFKCNDQ